MKRILPLILILAITLASCEKLFMPKGQNRPADIEVFDDLWRTLDEGYALFDEQGLNWDSLRVVYGAKLFDTMTTEQFYDTCAELISHLKDGNIVLEAGFDTYRYRGHDTDYQENFDRLLVERVYLKNAKQTGPFRHTIIDSVAYIYLNTFADRITEDQIDIIVNQYLDSTVDLYGIIFDIRNNEGGDPENMYPIFRRMGYDTSFSYSTLLYKVQYKNGAAHDHYTDLQPSWVDQSSKPKFPERFALLINGNTRGVANVFATGAFSFPTVKIFGDTTGGGDGKVTVRELPNGWLLKYPSTRVLTSDNDVTSFGMWPDSLVSLDPVMATQGKDAIIEDAMKYIRAGK